VLRPVGRHSRLVLFIALCKCHEPTPIVIRCVVSLPTELSVVLRVGV
jgi:hypothetical protein